MMIIKNKGLHNSHIAKAVAKTLKVTLIARF